MATAKQAAAAVKAEVAANQKPKGAPSVGRGPAKATAAQVKAQTMTTGRTVSVACKMPVGMNLGNIHGLDKPPVILRGSDHPFAVGHINGVGGYGLTHGIGRDEFEKWQAEHHWLPAVKNGLIFAHEHGHMAKAMAAEMSPEFNSGFDPIDPENPDKDERVNDAIGPTDEQSKVTAEAKDQREELLDEMRQTTPAEDQ